MYRIVSSVPLSASLSQPTCGWVCMCLSVCMCVYFSDDFLRNSCLFFLVVTDLSQCISDESEQSNLQLSN